MCEIMITGHRPKRLGNGYYLTTPIGLWLRKEIKEALYVNECERGITGVALGTDTIFALACIELHIPYKAIVPFKGQDERWLTTARAMYNHIISMAEEVIYIHKGEKPLEGWDVMKLYDNRNKWMVNYIHKNPKKNKIISVYDGSDFGGTYKCLKYANSLMPRLDIININPKDFKPANQLP